MFKKISFIFFVMMLSCSLSMASQKGSYSSSPMKEMAKKEMKPSMMKAYDIDVSHSTIGFAVKHLQVGTTRGIFDVYEGIIHYDPTDLSSFRAELTIQTESIDTNNEGRDKHLRSPDFFDVEQFETITFDSNRLEKRGGGHVIVGDLTIRDVTKQLTIPVELSGPVKGMRGSDVIGLNARITINRQDFGVSFSKKLDNGGLVVADMVDLIIEIEAHHNG